MTTDADRVLEQWRGLENGKPQTAWYPNEYGMGRRGIWDACVLRNPRKYSIETRDLVLAAALAPAPQAADAKPVAWHWRFEPGLPWHVCQFDDQLPARSLYPGLQVEPLFAAAAPLSASPISPSDPMTIIAGIRQFGLAADGGDLRDLEAAVAGLMALPEGWALVPNEPTPEMLGAWWRTKNCSHFHDEPPPTDISDYAAYRAMLAAAQEGNGNV